MGLRIYNGWKFARPTTLDEVFFQCQAAKPAMRALADEVLRKQIIELAASRMDRWLAGHLGLIEQACELDDHTSPASNAHFALDNRRALLREKNCSDHMVDVQSSLVVIPHASGTYAISLCPNATLRQAQADHFGLEDFCYYDDEAPEGVSEQEWLSRRDTWTSLLGDTTLVSMAGPVFNMVPDQHLTPHLDRSQPLDLSGIPGLEERSSKIARDMWQSGLGQVHTPGEVMRLMQQLKDDPPPAYLEALARVRQALPDPIPQAWFYMKKPELLGEWESIGQQVELTRRTPQAPGAGRGSPRI